MKTPGNDKDIKTSGHHGALAGETAISGTVGDKDFDKSTTGISGSTGIGEKVDTSLGKTSS